MATQECLNQFPSDDGKKCCDRCPEGQYLLSSCNNTAATECRVCEHETYMDTRNHRKKCFPCRICSSSNHQITRECEAKQNRQCGCVDGFFCMGDDCQICQKVTHCPAGEGVVRKATRTNDTECAPCPAGTYSNVSDFSSPCRKYTSCKELGRVLKTEGNSMADAVCGGFVPKCPSWMLPAGLWAGLIMTVLLIAVSCIIYRQVKQRSSKKVVRVADPVCPVELPFPMAEGSGHCQESSDKGLYRFAAPDTGVTFCTHDLDSMPTTPLTVTAQFVPANYTNGNAGNCTSPFMRTHSEPQEDEWGGV